MDPIGASSYKFTQGFLLLLHDNMLTDEVLLLVFNAIMKNQLETYSLLVAFDFLSKLAYAYKILEEFIKGSDDNPFEYMLTML